MLPLPAGWVMGFISDWAGLACGIVRAYSYMLLLLLMLVLTGGANAAEGRVWRGQIEFQDAATASELGLGQTALSFIIDDKGVVTGTLELPAGDGDMVYRGVLNGRVDGTRISMSTVLEPSEAVFADAEGQALLRTPVALEGNIGTSGTEANGSGNVDFRGMACWLEETIKDVVRDDSQPCEVANLAVTWRAAGTVSAGDIQSGQTPAPRVAPIEVLTVAGEVELAPGGDESRARVLQPGDRIERFDRIITGLDSNVTVRFPDGSVVEIGELSNLQASVYKDEGAMIQTRLWLAGGRVTASVNRDIERPSDFAVKTPTATAGVRGTKFSVTHRDDSEPMTVALVLEGSVVIVPEFSAGQAMRLDAGAEARVGMAGMSATGPYELVLATDSGWSDTMPADAPPPGWPASHGGVASPVAAGAGCDIAGQWQMSTANVGTSRWTFTPLGGGRYAAQESGLGNAGGTATVAGNAFRLEWRTTGGWSGIVDLTLAPDCGSGQGRHTFLTGRTGSEATSWRRTAP